MNVLVILIVAIMGPILIYAIMTFNKLVRIRLMSEEGWSGIEVQLKKRHSLVPNLLAVAKKFAAHEEKVFNQIAQSREKCMGVSDSVKASNNAESLLSKSIGSLLAIAENYPELKSDSNFLKAQEELSNLEDGIEMARRYYNGTVRDLNAMTEMFPSNIIASIFNFHRRDFFEIEDDNARLDPKID